MNLLLCEVKSSLVIRPSGIHDHAVDSSLVLYNLVNGGGDGGFLGDICLDGLEPSGVFGLRGGELLTGLGVVDGVHDLGVVVEA